MKTKKWAALVGGGKGAIAIYISAMDSLQSEYAIATGSSHSLIGMRREMWSGG